MKRILTIFCMVSLLGQAQANSVWEEGSQWDVYFTTDCEDTADSGSLVDEVKVTYRLLHANDNYMALEKIVIINDVQADSLVQGYIRNDNDTMIYVRPVLEDGSIGDECILYDFRVPYEYGGSIKYGVMGGVVKEEFFDWQEDSLDYYMLNNGDQHCLPAWKGIIYKYGYIGGPMDLFLLEAAPGKTNRPKPTNISHVIFSTKGGHKKNRMNGEEDDDDIIIPYNEILSDGTTWECLAVSTEQPDLKHTYTIEVKGDTLIGERRCKQVYSPEHHIQKIMFEEGRKVYVLNSEDNPEILLDFGLQVNDVFNDSECVIDINTITNLGYDYHTIYIDTGLDCQSYFAGDTEPWVYYLIEGIGISKDQHLENHRFLSQEDTFSYLLRCWKNGILVYQVHGYDSGISEISTTTNSLIYDLQGRPLKTIPQQGIYIYGNKKMIRK